MRLATLQFSPKLGQISTNIDRANALLTSSKAQLSGVDLLIVPELAFTGYNFPSLDAILPHLEPTASGPSTTWATAAALKYNCIVSVGYPELYAPPTTPERPGADPPEKTIAYNSTVTVSPDGTLLAHYRKTHLYYTDETWAQEGPEGFTTTRIHFPAGGQKKVAFGICMDLNPYRFATDWQAYEFARAAITSNAEMVVLSNAWLTSLPVESLREAPDKPDAGTFSYWVERLKPLCLGEREVVVVLANRTGEEEGNSPFRMDDKGVQYAGTSWIGKIGRGKIEVWEMCGRGWEGVCVADEGQVPKHTFDVHGEEDEEDEDEQTGDERGKEQERTSAAG